MSCVLPFYVASFVRNGHQPYPEYKPREADAGCALWHRTGAAIEPRFSRLSIRVRLAATPIHLLIGYTAMPDHKSVNVI